MHAIVSDLDIIRLFSSNTRNKKKKKKEEEDRRQSFTFESFEWLGVGCCCWSTLSKWTIDIEREIPS